MTSLSLLLWIVGGIALQLVIYLAIAFGRHWIAYRKLLQDGPAAEPPLAARGAAPPQEAAFRAAWQGFRAFRVAAKTIEDALGNIASFTLVPGDGQPLPAFLPGQFLTFRLDTGHTGGGEALVRCYSLSAGPRPDHYRISVKRVPAPPGSDFPPGRSSNFLHDHVRVGDTLQVRAPGGHFYLPPGEGPVVLIGGGIGITPMMSMAEWALSAQPGREIWLFYGLRDAREAAFLAPLRALAAAHPAFRLRLCFSQPQPGEALGRDYHHTGRVDVDLLRRSLPLKPYHFYICGPTPMLRSLVADLEDWGVPAGRIHFEAFGPASIQRKTPLPPPAAAFDTASGNASENISTPPGVTVTFARSGKTALWDGSASLLEFAEGQGIAVDSGCRAGGCGCCQTTLRAGEVAYRQTPDYDPEPGACLLCVCVPKTSLTLEA